jgi:hypothetical protein
MGCPEAVTPVAPSVEQGAPAVTYAGSLGGGAGVTVVVVVTWVTGGGWCVVGGGACLVVMVIGSSVVTDSLVVTVVGVSLLVAVVVVAAVLVTATTGCGMPGCRAGAVGATSPVMIMKAVTPPPNETSSRDHTGVRHHQRASAEGTGAGKTVMYGKIGIRTSAVRPIGSGSPERAKAVAG